MGRSQRITHHGAILDLGAGASVPELLIHLRLRVSENLVSAATAAERIVIVGVGIKGSIVTRIRFRKKARCRAGIADMREGGSVGVLAHLPRPFPPPPFWPLPLPFSFFPWPLALPLSASPLGAALGCATSPRLPW